MITASEPLEFIPRGRQAVEEHPGPFVTKKQTNLPSEHILLHRLQNVNISCDESSSEFWSVREINSDENEERSNSSNYFYDYNGSSEEELYVKGHTAVWSKGIISEEHVPPKICFTCETPIKFAFFCSPDFTKSESFVNNPKISEEIESTDDDFTGICLIDNLSLKVYCNQGENYMTSLEFPVSNVWSTKFGILLEKDASSTIIESQSILMPRLFSLSHPLDEMCPVLIKPINGIINYLTEADFKVVFTTLENNFVLLYDSKTGRHFICKLRNATDDETTYIGGLNDTTGFNFSANTGIHSSSHNNSMKIQGIHSHSTSTIGRTSCNNTTHSPYSERFLNSGRSSPFLNSPGGSNKTLAHSPLIRLHSSLLQSSTFQDIRKIGQPQPSRPIVPELCLEQIWLESSNIEREYFEVASHGFMHTDFIGQTYLCYLLPRTGKLNLIRMEKSSEPGVEIFGMTQQIPAKDAVSLKKMNMIVVLAPCGTVMIYSGSTMVGKLHVGGILSKLTTSSSLGNSFISSFPRRSSLLPTVSIALESRFDEELHSLSPVHPLQPNLNFNLKSGGHCSGLRDPAGNRLTISYPGGKFFRFSVPLMCESVFVKKCLLTLRQVLKKDLAMHLIIKWYGARNAPGSQDFSPNQEWLMFQNILLELIGRSWPNSDSLTRTHSVSGDEPKKRRKSENQGTDADWEFLMNYKNGIKQENEGAQRNDSQAQLFPYIPLILFSLHLLYEEMKLDSTMLPYLEHLGEFLYRLSLDLQLDNYCLHYFLDFPKFAHIQQNICIPENDLKKLQNQNYLDSKLSVPNLFKNLNDLIINGTAQIQFPFIRCVNEQSKHLIQIISLIFYDIKNLDSVIKLINPPGSRNERSEKKIIETKKATTHSERIIYTLLKMGIVREDLKKLPFSLNYIISEILEDSRSSPPIGCGPEAYELLLRPELVVHASKNKKNYSKKVVSSLNTVRKEHSLSRRNPPAPELVPTPEQVTEDDGMENMDTKLFRLRFPEDLRINDVQKFLNSSNPAIIDIAQAPNVSDHDFIEEQEKQLFTLCTRTMALPTGRGMFTLRTCTPLSTESLPIPKLCLTGKEPLKGATIEIQQIEVPANMNMWPLFHNGVAAGLRISPNAKDIDSTWIVYNKPKVSSEIPTEHAGFLMALGLNGHLKSLSFMSIYEYLVKCDEMTSLGLLLGISAAHRGTMDTTSTKLLSVHIEALLPPTAIELDIPQNIQVASIMGVGLLYQGTAKRHIAEVLLQEIGRPPGPEMENCVERESYSLTAGLALGLVTLGLGEQPAGLRDLQLPDTLHHYMVGGNKRPLTGAQKDKYKLPSFQIREGDVVNIDVTAPGAILALGLMFFKTNNNAVANWMKPPETTYLLDFVRPDLLQLRMIAKGLILWDQIQPTKEWIDSQFPSELKFDLKEGFPDRVGCVDHEAMCQAYCNIITGAAICVGLKYAGTEDRSAFETLEKCMNVFISANGLYLGEFAGKATIESCLIMILLSLSLVFAGSGNLKIIRMIRMLRSRIGTSNSHVTYGSQMAIHMALGFLFLGAGRFTISKTPQSIAALVCALFPKFPTHSNDNRYHLQAFRHLYVLAIEPRLILPRDIDSGKLSVCQIAYVKMGIKELITAKAPCMLPDLESLESIYIKDSYFWNVSFEKGRNWDQLKKLLSDSSCIDIKQRAGCLSRMGPLQKLRILLDQTMTKSPWKIGANNLLSFSSDPFVVSLTNKLLIPFNVNKLDGVEEASPDEMKIRQILTTQTYDCLFNDKMHGLPIYISILMSLKKVKETPTTFDIWQFKIISSALSKIQSSHSEFLLSSDIIRSSIIEPETLIEDWANSNISQLKQYLFSANTIYLQETDLKILLKIAAVVVFYDVPINVLNLIDLSGGQLNYIKMIVELKKLGLGSNTIRCIFNILNSI